MLPVFTAAIQSFRYRDASTPLLRQIQLSLNPGDILVIHGVGGCGKTTLCYCLSGVIPGFYHSGELEGVVRVGDANITHLGLAEAARFVGLMLQAPERQLFNLSVAEDIAFGPESFGLPPAEIRQLVQHLSGRLHLEPLLARPSHTLSAGETQRVALAATLALRPPVLVFDQPVAHLDPASRDEFYRLVAFLAHEEGKMVVIAESNCHAEKLQPLATQLLHLPDPEGIPFGESLPLNDPVGAWPDDHPPPEAEPELALCVDHLSFAYRHSPPVLCGASIVLQRGECAALVGSNGSGKTTLLRLISGLLAPRQGSVALCGHDVTRLSAAGRSTQLAYLPQDPDPLLYCDSVQDEIEAALRRPMRNHLPGAGYWLRLVGLDHRARAHPLTLSHGERYRLALVVLLARRPTLLLLDEPTSQLDRGESALLGRLLRAFCAAGGSALVATHDLDQLAAQGTIQRVFRMSDRRISETSLEEETTPYRRSTCKPH